MSDQPVLFTTIAQPSTFSHDGLTIGDRVQVIGARPGSGYLVGWAPRLPIIDTLPATWQTFDGWWIVLMDEWGTDSEMVRAIIPGFVIGEAG